MVCMFGSLSCMSQRDAQGFRRISVSTAKVPLQPTPAAARYKHNPSRLVQQICVRAGLDSPSTEHTVCRAFDPGMKSPRDLLEGRTNVILLLDSAGKERSKLNGQILQSMRILIGGTKSLLVFEHIVLSTQIISPR